MKRIAIYMVLLLSMACAVWAKPEMKTHSSDAMGAKVTVVHFGAPW